VRIVRWFGILHGPGMLLLACRPGRRVRRFKLVKVPVEGQVEGFDFIKVVMQEEDISKTNMTIC